MLRNGSLLHTWDNGSQILGTGSPSVRVRTFGDKGAPAVKYTDSSVPAPVEEVQSEPAPVAEPEQIDFSTIDLSGFQRQEIRS